MRVEALEEPKTKGNIVGNEAWKLAGIVLICPEIGLSCCNSDRSRNRHEHQQSAEPHKKREPNIRVSYSDRSDEEVRWSPWPCAQCAQGSTPVGFLKTSHGANSQVSDGAGALGINEGIDFLVRVETGWLQNWCASCAHSGGERVQSLNKIAEGSEHSVYQDRLSGDLLSDVIKLTQIGLFGDYYEFDGIRISQFKCTPGQYLKRLELLEGFGLSMEPMGITSRGQIVSRQKFIEGECPSQKEVDEFMEEGGMIPVKSACFLWKMEAENGIETWIGDVRDENFVKTPAGLVPIDVRMWVSSV